MSLEIVRQGETSTFTTILKDETGTVIPRSALTGLTLTFKNKRAAGSKSIRVGAGTDSVNAGSDTSLKITGDITIEARIKLEDPLFPNPLVNNEIFNNEGINDGFVFREDSTGGKLMYRTKQAGVNQLSRTSKGLTTRKWHDIAVTRSGAVATFYIDGEVAAKELDGSHIDPVASTSSHSLLLRLNGFADFVRVYNRVLTADEIKSRYQYNLDIQIGLVSEWKFEGSAKDSKGSNHGTLSGVDILKNWGLINDRYEQNVRDVGTGAVNNHTMGATDGLLTWSMQPADNPILESLVPEGDLEEHVAEYTWSTATRTGKHVVSIWVKRALA